MSSHVKIELPLKPIWMRQPDESERMYAAFIAWVSAERYVRPKVMVDKFGVPDTIINRNRWQERADEYWADTSRVLSQSVASMVNRLKVQALEAAQDLMLEKEYEETEHKVTPDGVTHTVRKKIYRPDARVVLRMLETILEQPDDRGNVDIAGLLQSMVAATAPHDVPPQPDGVVEQPSAAQHRDGGTTQ